MNRKQIILGLSVLLNLNISNAQDEKVDYQILSRIKDEAFNHSKVMSTAFQLTEVVGPRLSGSSNLKNAQLWAQQQLMDWGMQNCTIEPWGSFGKGWEVKKSYLAMSKPYYQPLIAIPKAWTPGTDKLIQANAIYLKVESESDLETYKGKLKDKIVIVGNIQEVKLGVKPEARRYSEDELHAIFMDKSLDENPENKGIPNADAQKKLRALRQKITQFLVEEGASAVISSRGGTMGTFFTTNGASYNTRSKPVLPEMEMGSEHINQLIRLLEAGKEVVLDLESITEFNFNDTIQYNVIAEIPGSDKNLKSELVMLGAHLDSWHASTGATDNAAGSAVMMEAMRILKVLDVKPRRTIRMALWSSEEQGLWGSRGYVKNHFANPDTMKLKPEHSKLSAYYNLDNGGGKIRGIYLQGNDALKPIFEIWLEQFKDMDASTVTTRNTGSTDHIAFDMVGLPGLQFIQDPLDYGNKTHHTNMDGYDRLQKADLMQASAIVAFIVYHTAMRDEKLPRKPLPVAKSK